MTRDSRTDPPSGRRVQPITNPQRRSGKTEKAGGDG